MMWHRHKWGRWKIVLLERTVTIYGYSLPNPTLVERQERECIDCGKIQRRDI